MGIHTIHYLSCDDCRSKGEKTVAEFDDLIDARTAGWRKVGGYGQAERYLCPECAEREHGKREINEKVEQQLF